MLIFSFLKDVIARTKSHILIIWWTPPLPRETIYIKDKWRTDNRENTDMSQDQAEYKKHLSFFSTLFCVLSTKFTDM